MVSKGKVIKAAVVQAEPEWFDLQGTVNKTCRLIEQAAANGANIVAFPELFIPGYPTWIWCVTALRSSPNSADWSGLDLWTSI